MSDVKANDDATHVRLLSFPGTAYLSKYAPALAADLT